MFLKYITSLYDIKLGLIILQWIFEEKNIEYTKGALLCHQSSIITLQKLTETQTGL